MPDGGALPGWPRALREDWAAAYVSLSPSSFRALVAPDVPPVRITPGRVAWLREDLDAWLDRRAGRITSIDPAPLPDNADAGDAHHDPIAAGLAALRPTKGRARRQSPAGRR